LCTEQFILQYTVVTAVSNEHTHKWLRYCYIRICTNLRSGPERKWVGSNPPTPTCCLATDYTAYFMLL